MQTVGAECVGADRLHQSIGGVVGFAARAAAPPQARLQQNRHLIAVLARTWKNGRN
jgi:hypothetical protein